MVKKTDVPARFKPLRPKKSTGKRLKRLTRAKKRAEHAKQTPGLLVRRTKVSRAVRESFRAQIDRFKEMTGIDPKGKKPMITRDFVEVLTAVLDAYGNFIMEMAEPLALNRKSKGSKTKGLKLYTQDVLSSSQIIHKIAKNE